MSADPAKPTVPRRWPARLALTSGLIALMAVLLTLRLAQVTDVLYSFAVKDPERVAPAGSAIVSPADGTVLYVRHFEGGVLPQVVKREVEVPVIDHLRADVTPPERGVLIGIYMNTQGVHINRTPDSGQLISQHVWNGPHMDMTEAERRIILRQLLPGQVTLRKVLGLDPFDLEDTARFVTDSARETLVFQSDSRRLFVVRIADYYVGRILTWVAPGDTVDRGQRLGMITWGSQTDLLIEGDVTVEVSVGDRVYGGESIVATY